MHIERRGSGQVTEFLVSGDVGVQHAAELRRQLLEAFDGGTPIHLDTSGVTEAHVPLFQLFCSAHRTALASNTPITHGPNWSAPVRAAAGSYGLPHAVGCPSCGPATCLWAGGRD
jgi:hypothetical protein